LSDSGYCMSTVLGLDHRSPLPPFLPIYRGEDALFSFLIRHCYAESYLGYVPWAYLHQPEQARHHVRDGTWTIPSVQEIYESFSSLIAGWSVPAWMGGFVHRIDTARPFGRS